MEIKDEPTNKHYDTDGCCTHCEVSIGRHYQRDERHELDLLRTRLCKERTDLLLDFLLFVHPVIVSYFISVTKCSSCILSAVNRIM